MGMYVKWIVIIIVLLFFITFGVKNSQPVYLNYYFNMESVELPLYGLAFICILLGILIGMIVGVVSRFTLKGRLRTLEKENKGLREKVTEAERERESESVSVVEEGGSL